MFSRGRNRSTAPAPSRIFSAVPTADSLRSSRRRLLDLGVGQLDRVGVEAAEEFVDAVDRVRRRILVLDEHFLEEAVARRVEQHALRRLAVATGAAGLLVVGFERPRQVEVDDRADVGLVDAHAEGVGGDDDLGLAAHEPVLGLGPLLAGQARVVDDGLAAQLLLEELADRLATRPARGVDDRRARASAPGPRPAAASLSASRRASTTA